MHLSNSALGIAWHRSGLAAVILVSQVVSLAFFVVAREIGHSRGHSDWILTLGPLVIIVALLLLRVLLARPTGILRQGGVLVDLPHFYPGEDNAKWMNILSQITQGKEIEIGGVGGVMVIFLATCWFITKAFTGLLALPFNQQSLVFNAQFVASAGLALCAPLVLVSHSASIKKIRNISTFMPLVVAIAFLSASLFRISFLGHLSEELTIVLFAMSLSVIAASDALLSEVNLAWLLLSFGSTVWLGLHFFSLVVLAGATGLVLIHQFSLVNRQRVQWLWFLALFLPMSVVWGTYRYTHITPVYLTSLFNAPGAVDAASFWQGAVAVIVFVLGLCLWNLSDDTWPAMDRTLPPLMVVGYFLLVAINDQWRTSKLNYGSTKLWFIVSVVLVTAYLVPAVQTISETLQRPLMGIRVATVCLAVVTVFILDGTFGPLMNNLRSEIWSGYASAQDHSFRDFVRTTTAMPQDLNQGPIGCVLKKSDGTLGINTETYSCTRFLVSLAGIETECNRVIEWQLGVTPGDLKSTLMTVQPRVRSRLFIQLNEQNLVTGQLTLDEIIQRLP